MLYVFSQCMLQYQIFKEHPVPFIIPDYILDSELLCTWMRFYFEVPERLNHCSLGAGKYQGQNTNSSMLWPLRCRGAPALVLRVLTVITTVTGIVCPKGVSDSVLGALHMPLVWPSWQPCEGGVFTPKWQLRKRSTELVKKEATFRPPSMRSLGTHELSSSGTPGTGKGL